MAVVVGLALLVRLGALYGYTEPPRKDAADYDRLGWSLAEGRGYVTASGEPTAFRPPGLPGLLAAVYVLCGHRVIAAQIVLAVVSAATVAATALLGATFGGPVAGLVAGLFAAVYPSFVWSDFGSRTLLAETLLAALMTWGLVVVIKTRSPTGAVAAGVLWGLAALTRGTALVAVAALAVVFCATDDACRRRAALLVVACAVVVAPWILRDRLVLGAWIPISSNGGLTLWQSYNPASRGLGHESEGFAEARALDEEWRARGLGEGQRSRAFAALARREIAGHPARAAGLVARKLLLFVDPTLEDALRPGIPVLNYGYAFVLPLALLGVVHAATGPARRNLLLLAAPALGYGTAHVVLHTAVRYRLAVEPILIALAGAGLAFYASRVGLRRAALLGGGWAVAVGVAAWRYDAIFTALSRLVRGLGLA